MGTLAALDAFVDRLYDDTQSYETISLATAINFLEDFIGAGHTAGFPVYGSPSAGYPWCKKIVGAGPPTVALVSNAGGGVAQIALVSTSEAEEALLAWNDSLSVDVTKRAQFEARVALTVPPSVAGVEVVWGLGSAWVSGPDNLTRLLQFGVSGSNALNIRVVDQSGLVTKAAAYQWAPSSQITLDANFHLYRIDATNPADIGFYFDGQRVNATGSIAFTTTGANAIMQPYLDAYRPSGTGLATLQVDKVDLGWMRQ
jgi:hypothetical protein